MMPVEDPFDATDNCARSIFASNAEYVSKCFKESLMATQRLQDPTGKCTVEEQQADGSDGNRECHSALLPSITLGLSIS